MRVNVAHATPPSPSFSLHSSSPFHPSHSSSLLHFSPPKSTSLKLRATIHDHDFIQNTHNQKLNLPTISNTTPFRHVDVLESSFLGIRPELPDWPARDEMIRECIARRASSIEIPLSLRMIKMKQRFHRVEEDKQNGDFLGDILNFNTNNSVYNICCSTLYIIKEVQSQALKIRGLILDEDLNGIMVKVQKEMASSFVWLFREVFAKTPDLMLLVMLLTSSFTNHSIKNYQYNENSNLKIEEKLERSSRNVEVESVELGRYEVPTSEILEEMDEVEVALWNSIVEEANKRRVDQVKDEVIGFVDGDHHGSMEHKFVSPIMVEIEVDDYEEYHKTDLLYQIGLSQEPNNTLLLSNYAQFLRLVSHDYDRAEECFKRATQSGPADAEVISQYANFLWVVRKDICGAEQQFQQAMANEPSNSYHASKYASFLWSTGSEDICHILDHHHARS